MRREAPEPRFWRKVRKTDTCWLWTAGCDTGGYGLLHLVGKKAIHASRYSWILHFGPLMDPTLDVLHTCDVRRCVNPTHLFLGNAHDNMQDMAKKGRHGGAKLNPDKVREIRRRVATGETYSHLGREYGVTWHAIRDVIIRHNYDYVD